MPRASYQYGTSPRKYEPEYRPRTTGKKTTANKVNTKKVPKKSDAKTSTIKMHYRKED